MSFEKIIYKEEVSFRSKWMKFLILGIGDIIGTICILIIIDAFKTELHGSELLMNNLIVGFCSILLVVVVLLTWGFFHSHSELKITKSGLSRDFKFPPFVIKKKLVSLNSIKSIMEIGKSDLIFKNGIFLMDNVQDKANECLKVVARTKDGKEEVFETNNPQGFIKAMEKMFIVGRK